MKIPECLVCLFFVLGLAEVARAQGETPGEWVARQRTLLHPQPVTPALSKTPPDAVTPVWLDKERWKLSAELNRLLAEEAERYRVARAAILPTNPGRRYLGADFQLIAFTQDSGNLEVTLENQNTHTGVTLLERRYNGEPRVEIAVAEQHLWCELELQEDVAEVEIRFLPPYDRDWGRNSLRALADLLGVEPSPAELADPYGAYRRLIEKAADVLEDGGDLELKRKRFRYGKGFRLLLRLPAAEARPASPQALAAYLKAEQDYMERVAELARPGLALAIESELLQPGSPPFQLGTSRSQRSLYTPETGWTARVTTDGCGGNVFVYEPADGTPRVVVHQTGTEFRTKERQSLEDDAAMRAVIVSSTRPARKPVRGLVGLGGEGSE